mgnify:CR=1 FL=1
MTHPTSNPAVEAQLEKALCALPAYSPEQQEELIASCAASLKALNATLVAHYYTDAQIQALADATGGFVSDSLEMARFGARSDADVIIVAGVRFMGETAKILTPEKRVIMPTLEATCSLDVGCDADEFAAFCDKHPDRTVVVYANTSAAVKARADWVVTSSIALDVVDYLDSQGEKILWAPDRYLGSYVQKKTGADMVLWDGSCVVHEEFKAQGIESLKAVYPNAAVLVHPESPESVVALADVVGSTSQLIKAARELPNTHCIVATDRAIFYKMQQAAPGKVLIDAPTGGQGATCRSCAHCPWMAMNTLERMDQLLKETLAAKEQGLKNWPEEIHLEDEMIQGARRSLDRMLAFKAPQK